MGDMESDGESAVTTISCITKQSSVKSVKSKYITSLSRNKDLRSGFLDKPRSTVMVKHKWPHMNQNSRYVTEALTFNQLTFPQFVGGECRTILKSTDSSEVNGRLRILSKVAYLFEQCRNWDRARSTYFAIISSIEEGKADWGSSFEHYDLMCPIVTDSKTESKGGAHHKSQDHAQVRLLLQRLQKRRMHIAKPTQGVDPKLTGKC